MSTLAVCILGAVVALVLPVSLMPEVDIPEISVHLRYPNSPAREIEQLATTPLRRELLQLAHLDQIESESRDGHALIRLKFDFGTHIDYAFLEVNEQIDAAMGRLPRDMPRPHIIKASATDLPVFYLNVSFRHPVDESKLLELSEFADALLRKRIEQLESVAMVDMTGLYAPEIRILPNMELMKSLGISQERLQQVLRQNNLNLGNLRIREGQYEYHIRFASFLRSPKDIGQVYLQHQGRLLQLKDLATISYGARQQQGLYLADGRPAIGMAIIKQADARMQDMKQDVEEVVRTFEQDYPDLLFTPSQDQSQLLDAALKNLGQALLLGGLLAFVVMFFFLGDFRSPWLVGLSIPVSLLVCLLCFWLLGISVNVISLSGLILGVGLMIDNSIIVIDNIVQHRQRGLDLSPACTAGTNEVIRPLISSALTTSAVFLPLVFLSGISGALFFDQAMAITIGLGASLLVSVSLLPTLYRLLYVRQGKKAGPTSSPLRLLSYERLYERSIRWVFQHRGLILAAFLLLMPLGAGLLYLLPLQRFPHIGHPDRILHIHWNEPLHLDENRSRVQALLTHLGAGLRQSNSRIGAQQFVLNKAHELSTAEAQIYLLAESETALMSMLDTAQSWQQQHYPRARFRAEVPPNLFEQLFANELPPLVAEISMLEENRLPELAQIQAVIARLRQVLGLPLAPLPSREYLSVQLLPERLAQYEVEHEQLFQRLKAAFNAWKMEEINSGYQLIPVVMQGGQQQVEAVIARTTVPNVRGEAIPVSALIRLRYKEDYQQLQAGKTGPYVPLAVDTDPQQAQWLMPRMRELIQAESGLSVHFSGSIFANRRLLLELGVVMGLALLLLYFILAAQFESLLQPLIVLLEVPMDLGGAALLLWLGGSSLNLMAMIGMVVMSGIIINDSILKIDTINRLRREGRPLMQAIHLGGQRRLKPIIMTSLTTILAALPLLFGHDLGSSLQRPLALALIGGMLLGTLVSVYFIPLAYAFLYRKQQTGGRQFVA